MSAVPWLGGSSRNSGRGARGAEKVVATAVIDVESKKEKLIRVDRQERRRRQKSVSSTTSLSSTQAGGREEEEGMRPRFEVRQEASA